jgi:uncharacterized membrane protein (DUF485 family)
MIKLNDSRVKELIKKQDFLSNFFTFLVLLIYFSFIIIIAFNPIFFSQTYNDMVITYGIICGFSIIIFSIILTFIYVLVSNKVLDDLRNQILNDEK